MAAGIQIITLRARLFAAPPIAGTILAAPKGESVCCVVAVTHLRTAGDSSRLRYRLTCTRHARAELSPGAVVLPWPAAPAPPPERLGAAQAPPQPAAIRKARQLEDIARQARAARVGTDDGVQNGRDFGPGLRLRPARGQRNEVLRAADVERVDGPDADAPLRTVRRARRSDPLARLLAAGTITRAHVDTVELFRSHLEASEGAIAISIAGDSGVHIAGHLRSYSDRQLNGRTHVRKALEAVTRINHEPVLWIAGGGTVSGYAQHVHIGHETASTRLRNGLDELAEHYRAHARHR